MIIFSHKYVIIQSFFKTLHDFGGCVWWILGLIALAIFNGGIFYTLSMSHYHLLIIALWTILGSLDIAFILGVIGFIFDSDAIAYIIVAILILFLMSLDWLLLYFVIRFNGYAFDFNYMHYNLAYIQWVAIWINIFLLKLFFKPDDDNDDSDSDSGSDSDSDLDTDSSNHIDPTSNTINVDPTKIHDSNI